VTKNSTILACVLGVAAACGAPPSKSPWIAGFTPPAQPAGSTRYVLPTIHGIPAGGNILYCQYIAGPSETARDVTFVSGAQSEGGHHVVIYATKLSLPIGTSRACLTEDQLNLTYLGAIGGEGVGSNIFAKLPSDVTFRLPAGWGLMANTHFVNTSNHAIDGQGVMDVMFRDVAPTDKPINLLTNVNTSFSLTANAKGSADVTCNVMGTYQSVVSLNHEHEWGSSAYTEVIHPDGTSRMLAQDPVWVPEYTFNPNLNYYPLTGDTSVTFQPGDKIHTHCEWDNNTSSLITFPQEMCVGVNFILADHEIDCVDGQWDVDSRN
jgi:hypothetical protein